MLQTKLKDEVREQYNKNDYLKSHIDTINWTLIREGIGIESWLITYNKSRAEFMQL